MAVDLSQRKVIAEAIAEFIDTYEEGFKGNVWVKEKEDGSPEIVRVFAQKKADKFGYVYIKADGTAYAESITHEGLRTALDLFIKEAAA
jgi:hypothetical protein